VGLGSLEDAATATLWRSHVLTRISRLGLVGKIRMAALDWSQCPAVESVPGKVGGAWVFVGSACRSLECSKILKREPL
jgi:hypothetical protein